MSSSFPRGSLSSLQPFSSTSSSRLQALYSDFSRQKHSNPASYHSNVDWWQKALAVVVSTGMQNPSITLNQEDTRDKQFRTDRLVLHAGRDLLDRLKFPKVGRFETYFLYISPLRCNKSHVVVCFDKSELRTSRTVYPVSEYLTAKVSIYDPGWLPGRIAAYVVGKPLWWALEQMGIVGEDGIISGSSSAQRSQHHTDQTWWGDYVFVPLLESAADMVMEIQDGRMAGPGDALYTFDSFLEVFGGVVGGDVALSETDAKVLLKYLERERGVIIVEKELIKFVDGSTASEEKMITAVDRGILELKTAIRNLHAQVESLQSKIDEWTRRASLALQQKRKGVAISYLKNRKEVEALLEKRLGSLGTLESTLLTVEAAAGDVEIMKSYESSTATLRSILAHPSLQRDNIDKTMDALSEANADARDIDDAVRMGADAALGTEYVVDDAELEDELRALVMEAEAEKDSQQVQSTQEKLAGMSPPVQSTDRVMPVREQPSMIPAS